MVINSYAKLNLYLAVLNRRRDNFHEIRTLFERISLSDTIILSRRPDGEIKIACSDPDVPPDESNLAWKSADLLRKTFGISRGLNIKIIKRVPVGAGLGGGSSNAAAVLTGLNKFWKLGLSVAKLAKLAQNLGSDVPFFVYNTMFAAATGRGEKIKPLKSLSRTRLWHILVVPRIKVPTPLIYRGFDKYSKSLKIKQKLRLTALKYNANILTLLLQKKDLSLINEVLFNSLEPVTCKLYPEVKRIREKLIESGIKAAFMSGSGPAVFGIVSSRKEAVSFCRQLKRENKRWRVFAAGTV